MANAEVRYSIDYGILHGRRRADGAGLADPLDTQGIHRRRRKGLGR